MNNRQRPSSWILWVSILIGYVLTETVITSVRYRRVVADQQQIIRVQSNEIRRLDQLVHRMDGSIAQLQDALMDAGIRYWDQP